LEKGITVVCIWKGITVVYLGMNPA
jgi:hypothetical protein